MEREQNDLQACKQLASEVEVGAFNIAEFLIEVQSDLNTPRFDGKSVLMLAMESNQLALVKQMIQQRAELNLKDDKGSTAVSIAMESRFPKEFLELLGEGNCDLNMISGRGLPAISLAASAGNIEALKLDTAHAFYIKCMHYIIYDIWIDSLNV